MHRKAAVRQTALRANSRPMRARIVQPRTRLAPGRSSARRNISVRAHHPPGVNHCRQHATGNGPWSKRPGAKKGGNRRIHRQCARLSAPAAPTLLVAVSCYLSDATSAGCAAAPVGAPDVPKNDTRASTSAGEAACRRPAYCPLLESPDESIRRGFSRTATVVRSGPRGRPFRPGRGNSGTSCFERPLLPAIAQAINP